MRKLNKKDLTKLISFMATFDGGIYRRYAKGNASFKLNMLKENLDYVERVGDVLSQLTGVTIVDRKLSNNDGCNRKPQVALSSRVHPFLTTLHERMYTPDGKKVLDLHMLKMLDAETLAIIFMCDGGSRVHTSAGSSVGSPDITLNTKGFSESDNLSLSKAIYEKFGIRSKVNRQNQFRYLRVSSKDAQMFCDTVAPYMAPSFKYKLERLAPTIELDDDIVCSKW